MRLWNSPQHTRVLHGVNERVVHERVLFFHVVFAFQECWPRKASTSPRNSVLRLWYSPQRRAEYSM